MLDQKEIIKIAEARLIDTEVLIIKLKDLMVRFIFAVMQLNYG